MEFIEDSVKELIIKYRIYKIFKHLTFYISLFIIYSICLFLIGIFVGFFIYKIWINI
jgi:hypothetical protein